MSRTSQILGYPDDARLLIINADDFGMSHAINTAITQSLQAGIVCSTSLMAPCPWALDAMEWLRAHTDVSFAVHLTLIAEPVRYKWGPLARKDRVPSLINARGYFHDIEQMDTLLKQAETGEVELEFRAQVEAVLSAGLQPTHLDWHCLRNGGRQDIFDLTVRLAKQYGLAVRAYDSPFADHLTSQGLPANDHSLLDSYALNPERKAAQYGQLLRNLPPGLTEWAVHPGLGNAEMQAIEPTSWQVRDTDFEFVMSEVARQTIAQEGIILLDYKALQASWQSRT